MLGGRARERKGKRRRGGSKVERGNQAVEGRRGEERKEVIESGKGCGEEGIRKKERE